MDPDLPALVATRIALHTVAEQLIAAELHRWNCRIGLRSTPRGFGTPVVDVDGVARQLRVEGVQLVDVRGGDERRLPITSIGHLAEHLGIEPGAPADVYTPATEFAPDRPLEVDEPSAALIADWFRLSAEALDLLAPAETPQLWPEHFDIGVSLDEVNYGGSPGDGGHELPYLYVGPWSPKPEGGFWNEPFGASLTWRDDLDLTDAMEFFETGRSNAAA